MKKTVRALFKSSQDTKDLQYFSLGLNFRYMDLAGARQDLDILGLGLHYSFTIGKWYKWKCRSNAMLFMNNKSLIMNIS